MPPTAEAPSADVPTAEADASDATTEIAPPPPPPAPGDPKDKAGRYVRVPAWLLVVLAAVVLAGGSFALGRATASDGDDEARSISVDVPDEVTPDLPEGDTPQVPNTNEAFLGVATESGDGGAQVVQVAPGSPADDAGLETGDVISEVDGDAVDGPEALQATIGEYEPGDEVTVTYERDGEEQETQAELADRTSPEEVRPN